MTMTEQDHMFRQRLAAVEENIRAACKRAGRGRDGVTLIAVSKTHPAEDVLSAVHAGLTVFGENRVQELREKAPRVAELLSEEASLRSAGTAEVATGACADMSAGTRIALPSNALTWHLIGTLQTNKVKYLPGLLNGMIHSVDNLKMAQEIDRQFARIAGGQEDAAAQVLLEVNMAGEDTKAGLAPEDVRALLTQIAPLPNLRVRGLMTIAPFTEDAESNRVHFRGLRQLLNELNAAAILDEPMTELSMGMSGDYKVAIEEGATFIRVGTALFGERDYGTA